MEESANGVRTVWWEPDAVCLIDQTKLPHVRLTVRCKSVAEVARSGGLSCAAPPP